MGEKIKMGNEETELKEKSGAGEASGGSPGWFKSQLSRRSVGIGMALAAVAGMAGVSLYKFGGEAESESSLDSLELQRREGWNVGAGDQPLRSMPGEVTLDSRQQSWNGFDPNYLISIYQPVRPEWRPYFVPTLLQSLNQPTLNERIRLIHNPEMAEAYARTGALRELLAQTPDAGRTMVVADLPGPLAVAVGAAMADVATLVPLFDNWPHPLGVVPAHETLGAMIYYAREIEAKRSRVGEKAPTILLLDSRRLTPYADADNQFDNRWMARVPLSDELRQRGIEQVIYLVRDGSYATELDDLNDEFVDWEKNGIKVRMLQLTDFKPDESRLAKAGGGAPAGTPTVVNHYYYGGGSAAHWLFYAHYALTAPRQLSPFQMGLGGGRTTPIPRPASLPAMSAPAYRPVSRPTIFASTRVGGTTTAGVGRTRPSGFGRTSVRVSSSGEVTGTRPGRSGSFGRGGSGISG